jgi:hypothetical protein
LRELCRLRVLENRVLRGIFWSKRDEVTEKWRRLHSEVFNDLYCSPNIICVIKSRSMRKAVGSDCGLTGRGVDDFVGMWMIDCVSESELVTRLIDVYMLVWLVQIYR